MDGTWDQKRQEQLRQYISSLARVASSGIWLSEPLTTTKPPTRDDRRSLSNLHTVTIRVRIGVGHLPFRPLRCSDPGACNFNEDTTALFIASNSSSTDFCSYACKTTSQQTVKLTSQSASTTRTNTKSDLAVVIETTPSHTKREDSNNEAEGWRAAFIVVITIFVILVIAGVVVLVIWWLRKRKAHTVHPVDDKAEKARAHPVTADDKGEPGHVDLIITDDTAETDRSTTNMSVRRGHKSPCYVHLVQQNQALRELMKARGLTVPDDIGGERKIASPVKVSSNSFMEEKVDHKVNEGSAKTEISESTDHTSVETTEHTSEIHTNMDELKRKHRRRRRRHKRKTNGRASNKRVLKKKRTRTRKGNDQRIIHISSSDSDEEAAGI